MFEKIYSAPCSTNGISSFGMHSAKTMNPTSIFEGHAILRELHWKNILYK